MQELLEKYKYYIGGSTIAIILFYLIYKNFFNNIDNKEIKEKNEIVKSEISHEEFLKTLTEELQKLRKSIIILNGNYLKSRNNSENLNIWSTYYYSARINFITPITTTSVYKLYHHIFWL